MAELFTPAYVADLEGRYPEVKRTGVITESVVAAEIARLETGEGRRGTTWPTPLPSIR